MNNHETGRSMKTKSTILMLAMLAGTAFLRAAETEAGPKGGRLLESRPLRAEFHVDAGRKVAITFYDDALKPVAPGGQTVSVIAEVGSGRVPLDMEKTSTGFASVGALPEGEPYRVVVQVRAAPDARPQNFRIDLNLEECGECERAEYACTCEGH
jgi:hypothetical protein